MKYWAGMLHVGMWQHVESRQTEECVYKSIEHCAHRDPPLAFSLCFSRHNALGHGAARRGPSGSTGAAHARECRVEAPAHPRAVGPRAHPPLQRVVDAACGAERRCKRGVEGVVVELRLRQRLAAEQHLEQRARLRRQQRRLPRAGGVGLR